MSEQAVVWKFAFGVIVLLFCGVALVTRKDAHLVAPAAEPIRMAPGPVAPPATGALPPAEEPAPDDVPDVPEAQEAPVRIRISLHAPAVTQRHRAAPRVARKVVHRRPHRLSPYVVGRLHYPFDPRERWQSPQG